jgi:hypothetical protein
MNGNTAYLIHHSKAKWRVAVRFPPLFLPNMKKVLFFCKRRFYRMTVSKGKFPANKEIENGKRKQPRLRNRKDFWPQVLYYQQKVWQHLWAIYTQVMGRRICKAD